MPERYVPVPYRALELADHEEWFAVLDLYKRAHSLRWAPFRVTERSLATKWRLGNRRLWSLLEQLEEQGLLTIRKGCNRTPTLVTVLCPTGEGPQSGGVQQSEQRTARQSGQRTGQQNNTDDNGVVGIHAAQVAAQDAAQPPAQAAENLLRPETSTETRPEDLLRPAKPSLSELFMQVSVMEPGTQPPMGSKLFRVWAFEQARHLWQQQIKKRRPRRLDHNGSALSEGGSLWRMVDEKGVEAQKLSTVLRWLRDSKSDRAQLYREKDNCTLVSVRRNFEVLHGMALDEGQVITERERRRALYGSHG